MKTGSNDVDGLLYTQAEQPSQGAWLPLSALAWMHAGSCVEVNFSAVAIDFPLLRYRIPRHSKVLRLWRAMRICQLICQKQIYEEKKRERASSQSHAAGSFNYLGNWNVCRESQQGKCDKGRDAAPKGSLTTALRLGRAIYSLVTWHKRLTVSPRLK